MVAALPEKTVVSTGLVRGVGNGRDPAGRVTVTVPLSPLSVGLAQPGTRVDLYAPPGEDESEATQIASDVRILSVRDESHRLTGDDQAMADVAIFPDVASVVLARASTQPLLLGVVGAQGSDSSSTTQSKGNHG